MISTPLFDKRSSNVHGSETLRMKLEAVEINDARSVPVPETNRKDSIEFYRGTEIGWPVITIVACILAFNQAMSVVTQEPSAMLFAIDSVLLLITIPFFALTIRVSARTIEWSLLFGLFPQCLRIESIQAVRTIPLSLINGYGVRGFGSKKLWRVSGSNAVWIELTDESIVALGVTSPLPLSAAIEHAMNDGKMV
jgi:hypothetical protein